MDRSDPYERILARPLDDAGPRSAGRFAQTIVGLVRHGLGLAVIDALSVAEVHMPGLVRRPLVQPATITAWSVTKRGRQLSSFAEPTVALFRREPARALAREGWEDG